MLINRSFVFMAWVLSVISLFLSSCGLPLDLEKLLSPKSSSAAAKIPDANYHSPNIGTLIHVPGGTFQYDATAGDTNTITTPFYMSQCDITRSEYVAVTGLADPVVVGGATASSTGTGDPVMMVNWYQAIYFCNVLSMIEGLTPVYTVSNGAFAYTDPANWPGGTVIPTADDPNYDSAIANWSANGYRLPTEMEWMWAAMGADTSNAGQVNHTGYSKAFPGDNGGNIINNYVWNNANSGTTTHPVGTLLSNELGLYDMSGNVWQWCWDWYAGSYPGGALTDYRGAASGTFRVYNGGTWTLAAIVNAISFRSSIVPVNQGNNCGFRVVRQ